jgi:hypothetical protein
VRRHLVLVLLALVAAGCGLLPRPARPPSPYCRGGNPLAGVYHPSRLHVRERCMLVTGTVTRVKFEPFDGDVHVDLEVGRGKRLIVEVIPQDRGRVAIPAEGERVSVVGPFVDDETHGWQEIHPAWWISSGRLLPASAQELRRAEILLRSRGGGEE